jgi:hypothetical protein
VGDDRDLENRGLALHRDTLLGWSLHSSYVEYRLRVVRPWLESLLQFKKWKSI